MHAGAGCISASASGGSCGTGAATAGFTKFASSNLSFGNGDFARLLTYSVIGGTASVIGGGKFENGALTGAFQYVVNELGSGSAEKNIRSKLGYIGKQIRASGDPELIKAFDVSKTPEPPISQGVRFCEE